MYIRISRIVLRIFRDRQKGRINRLTWTTMVQHIFFSSLYTLCIVVNSTCCSRCMRVRTLKRTHAQIVQHREKWRKIDTEIDWMMNAVPIIYQFTHLHILATHIFVSQLRPVVNWQRECFKVIVVIIAWNVFNANINRIIYKQASERTEPNRIHGCEFEIAFWCSHNISQNITAVVYLPLICMNWWYFHSHIHIGHIYWHLYI